MVEGTLDALAIATTALRAGAANRFCPLTQSGRELSTAQLGHVLHMHPNPPIVAFDADPAGRDSTIRLATAARRKGVSVQVARLPEGQDPASFLATSNGAGIAALTGGPCRGVGGALRLYPHPKPSPACTPVPDL